MTDAAFVIRLSYGPSLEREFHYRLGVFREHTLPSLIAQTTPADVWVWTHPRHVYLLASLGVHPFTVDGSPDVLSVLDRPWGAVHRLPRYPVQILLGSDDWLSPHFVERAVVELGKISEPRAIVTFQPYKHDRPNDRWYRVGRPYSETRCSPMLAMRQPDDERYTWVWARGHTRLHEHVDRVVVVEEGYCALTVHGGNLSTEVVGGDVPIASPTWR